MSQVTVSVSLPKEFSELADGLANLISVIKPKLADGLQPGDAPAVFAAIVAFFPALKGVEQLGSEAVEDPEAFAVCAAMLLGKVVKAARS